MQHNFSQLYEEYADRIYRFVYVRTNHKQIAEDLTSDIFFKALNALPKIKGDVNFTAWLFTIARNRVIDHYRTFKPSVDLEDVIETVAGVSLQDEVHNRLLLEKITESMKQLTEKDREIILLRVWDGLSHAEIAGLLSSTEAAVKVAYMRAMKKLNGLTLILLLLSLHL